MRTSNGLYREVEIYDDIVRKYQRFINEEEAKYEFDSAYRFDMVEACQRNELGFWNEFKNNGALCPILPGSNLYCIYMKRAITEKDYDTTLLATGFYLKGQESMLLKLALEDPSMYYDVSYIVALGKELANMANISLSWSGFVDGLNEIYRRNRKAYNALMEDLHGGNIGILDGNLVIIDYGCIDPVY